MKKEYNIKDTVWIHIGERTLTQGRIVDIFDLTHLEEGPYEDELYVVEIPTGIDNTYEVRTYEQLSPDATGPIALFRGGEHKEANRLMKKVGMPLPEGAMEYEPTPDEIHAALQRSQDSIKHDPLPTGKRAPAKKRFYKKKATKA
jgi:hypothetical protein